MRRKREKDCFVEKAVFLINEHAVFGLHKT